MRALLLCASPVSSSELDLFAEFQSIPTSGAKDWEAFAIARKQYLTVANQYGLPGTA